MKNFDVNFQYPLRLLVIIPALVAILIPLLRMPKKRRTLKKKLPAVLHSAVAILLALAIAGMQFSSVSSDQSVIVLVDESESTSKIREELDSTAQQIVDSLDSDIPVAAVCFSDKQYSLFDFDSQDRSIWTDNFLHSNSTNIEGALEHAASLFPVKPSFLAITEKIDADTLVYMLLEEINGRNVSSDPKEVAVPRKKRKRLFG